MLIRTISFPSSLPVYLGSIGRRLVAGQLMAACAALNAANAADAALIEAAKKEGQVVWYTTFIVNQATRPLVEAFQAKYPGIEVKFARYNPDDIVLRISLEAKAGKPQSDVVNASSAVIPLKAVDAIEPYQSSERNAYPASAKDTEGYWTALAEYVLTPAVNTQMVPAGREPKSLDDLLDPAWKGKIGWATDPSLVGPPGFVGSVLSKLGDANGMEYLRKLAKQQPINVAADQRVVVNQVIAGEYPLALMTFNNHSVISASKGAPVKWLKFEPSVEAFNVISLVKNGPHPNAGKLLVDYLLSEDGQKVLKAVGYLPAHPRVEAEEPSIKPEYGQFNAVVFSPDDINQLPRWTSIYRDLFR